MVSRIIHSTEHGAKRAEERMGLKRSQSERLADKAIMLGLRASDTAGSLRRYLDGIYLSHKSGAGYSLG